MANMIHCPNCKQQYVVQPSLANKQVQCTQCGQAFHMSKPLEPRSDAAVTPASHSVRQPSEPTLLGRGAASMGFMLLAIIVLGFATQLNRTGQVGPISLAIYAVLTLMAVGLMIPRFWHAPLEGALFAGKAIFVVLVVLGLKNILGLDNDRPRPKSQPVTSHADQEPPSSPRAEPIMEPSVEPDPCGQPVTFWNVRVNDDVLSATSFTAEYRVDQPELLDSATYVWLVCGEFHTIEIPVTLDNSGCRATLQGVNLRGEAAVVSDFLEDGWQSHLQEIRGAMKKRTISNTVTVELTAAPLR